MFSSGLSTWASLAIVVCVIHHPCVHAQPLFGGSEIIFGDVVQGSDTDPPSAQPHHTQSWEEDVDTRRSPFDLDPHTVRPVAMTGPDVEAVDTRQPSPRDSTDESMVTEAADTRLPPRRRPSDVTRAPPQEEAVDTVGHPAPGDAGLPTEETPLIIAGLPKAEDCEAVSCNISVVQGCSDRPVLYAKQCCPVCLDAQEMSKCSPGLCRPMEHCSVHQGQPVCCTRLRTDHRQHEQRRHHVHHRHHIGSQTEDTHDLVHLLKRYPLPGNCALSYLPEIRRRTGLCGECRAQEVCEKRTARLLAGNGNTITVERTYCCQRRCPAIRQPLLLGQCHLPGQPVPAKTHCSCTLYGHIREALDARRQGYRHGDKTYTTLRYVLASRDHSGGDRDTHRHGNSRRQLLRLELCFCRRNHQHSQHVDDQLTPVGTSDRSGAELHSGSCRYVRTAFNRRG
eukprot:scpid64004/ scgid32851/ 